VITVFERHRQTDGQTTYCRITALCIASCGKNTSTDVNCQILFTETLLVKLLDTNSGFWKSHENVLKIEAFSLRYQSMVDSSVSKYYGDGGCSFIAAYRRANGSSPWAWSKGRRPSGAVLHSLSGPGVRRPCSDFMDMLQRLINCRIIITIIINAQRHRQMDRLTTVSCQ